MKSAHFLSVAANMDGSEDSEIFDIFLHPGEYAVASEPCRIRTLLGSCVAVTLWHPTRKIGTMSHCILPTLDRSGAAKPGLKQNGKYCDQVIDLMLAALADMGIEPTECQAKIFGGSSMYPQQLLHDQHQIGQKNGEMARRLLTGHRIPIVSESMFGVGHRQIAFDLSSGDVWVRHGQLPVLPNDA